MALRAITSMGLAGLLLQAGCAGTVANRGSSPARLAGVATYADYPALHGPGPSGIGLVTPAEARNAARSATRPLWVTSPRGRAGGELPRLVSVAAATPEIASAREVEHAGRARVWIARSSDGGVCVLSFRPELDPGSRTYHTVSAACGPADGLARGAAQVERVAGRHARWLVSGVAPREITAVTLRLAGGGARTVPVTNDSYSASVDRPVEGLAFVDGGMRH